MYCILPSPHPLSSLFLLPFSPFSSLPRFPLPIPSPPFLCVVQVGGFQPQAARNLVLPHPRSLH